MRTFPLFKVLVAVPVALLLVEQLSWSARRLLAEYWSFPAVASLEWWDEWAIDPDDAQWQPARERLERALRYMPDDPELLANVGDLYTRRLDDESLAGGQTREAVAMGSTAYLGSLRQRPTWVRDWDDLALIKYNQGLYRDADYQLALRQMPRFGSKRVSLMALLTDMGIKSWDELDDTTRTTLRELTDIEQERARRRATSVAGVGPGDNF